MSFGSNKQSSTENVNQTQTAERLFNSPEAKQLLSALSGVYNPTNLGAAGSATSALSGLAGEGQNPFLEEQIRLGRAGAQDTFNTNLAKVRAAGYRGGTGANAVNQGLLASDFSTGLAANENQMRYQNFNDSFSRRLAASTALAGQGNSNVGNAAQILNLLAGTKTKTTGTNTGTVKGSQSGFDVGSILGGLGGLAGGIGLWAR